MLECRSESVDTRWDLRACISNKLCGSASALGNKNLSKEALKTMKQKIIWYSRKIPPLYWDGHIRHRRQGKFREETS